MGLDAEKAQRDELCLLNKRVSVVQLSSVQQRRSIYLVGFIQLYLKWQDISEGQNTPLLVFLHLLLR